MSVYSVTQEPNVLVGTGQPIIFTAFDTETANIYPNGDADVWKFRYICDIYIDTGSGSTKVARLKQLPNAENVGIFDISRIVNSFLYPTLVNQGITTNSIHTLPLGDLGDPFSLNDSSLETVICKFGEEFATTATGSPTVHADRHTETARYAFQASVPYNAGVNYAFGDFISNGTTKRFLTYMPDYSIQGQTIKVSNNEWRTMTFLNDSAICCETFTSTSLIMSLSERIIAISGKTSAIICSLSFSKATKRLISLRIFFAILIVFSM